MLAKKVHYIINGLYLFTMNDAFLCFKKETEKTKHHDSTGTAEDIIGERYSHVY